MCVMRDWDIGEWLVYGLLFLVLGGAALFVIVFVIDIISWSKTPIVEKECYLISGQVTPSTQDVGVGVGLNGRNVAPVIVSIANSEKQITIWECDGLGKIVSKNKTVFRLAKTNAVLLIKQRGDEFRVEGIKQ